MFIPLHDKNPRILIARPWVTLGVIAACTAIFAVQIWLSLQGQGRLLYGLSLIPATLSGAADLPPPALPGDT